MGLLSIFRGPPANSRARRAGAVHRRERRVRHAKGHLRVLPRARRALRQGPVLRAGVPGGRRAVALARLSARACHGRRARRGRAAPRPSTGNASSTTRFARSFCRFSTAIRSRRLSTRSAWRDARAELDRRLQTIGLHPPKRSFEIADPYAQAYFDLMPIHEKLRARDFPTMHNYLKLTLCNIHIELTKRIDRQALIRSLHG